MNLLTGKWAVVAGVADENSIAWGITRALVSHGAKITLLCGSDDSVSRTKTLVSDTRISGSVLEVLRCDVTSEADCDNLGTWVQERSGKHDIFVHSIAGGPGRSDLKGEFLGTKDEIYQLTNEVSAWSFKKLAEILLPSFRENASLLGITYGRDDTVESGYNVMTVAKAGLRSIMHLLARDLGPKGIRVNLLSPGPIKTRSALAIRGLKDMLEITPVVAPLRRNTTAEAVGDVAVAYASDLTKDVTGTIVPIDCGMHLLSPYTLLEEVSRLKKLVGQNSE